MSTHLHRQYKDRVFRDIFGREENKRFTLSLYNAVNGTAYEDPDLIELNTLEDFIYMNMKNDVSFLVDAQLELYEHQSTYNPNMPFRCLQYLSTLYDRHLESTNQKKLLYADDLVRLPTPKCVVFYNGERQTEDQFELHLKDAFSAPEKACIDLVVQVFNCNEGRNRKLMEHCRELADYAAFVALSRKYLKSVHTDSGDVEQQKANAVTRAIDETVSRDGPLADYFKSRRNEVCAMFLEDYDEEATLKAIGDYKEQKGYTKGLEQGQTRTLELIRMMKEGKTDDEIIASLNCTLSDIQQVRAILS